MYSSGYARKSDINSHDTQINQYWSFCDRTQKSSAPLLGICVSTSGVSADMHSYWRRKSDINSHDTQINQYWSFCDCTQKSSAPLLGICVSTSGVSAGMHSYWRRKLDINSQDTQIIQYWSFCDRKRQAFTWRYAKATSRINEIVQWLADATFDWRHVMEMAVERNNQTCRFITYLRRFYKIYTKTSCKIKFKYKRWISFFLTFIEAWTQRVPCKVNVTPDFFFWHSSKYERNGSCAKLL